MTPSEEGSKTLPIIAATGELNDPQLANAGQTQAVFEFMHTYDYWLGVE